MQTPSGVWSVAVRSPPAECSTWVKRHREDAHFVGWAVTWDGHSLPWSPGVSLGMSFFFLISWFPTCKMGRVTSFLDWPYAGSLPPARMLCPVSAAPACWWGSRLETVPALMCLECSIVWKKGIQTCSTASQRCYFPQTWLWFSVLRSVWAVYGQPDGVHRCLYFFNWTSGC